jgi:hypothetical protein
MEKTLYKDPRYTTIYFLLQENALDTFAEIFLYLPFTIVARDLGIGNPKMKRIVTGDTYDKGLIREIADLIGCEQEKLLALALKQYDEKKCEK